MRGVSLFALLATSLTLAGCGGGGSGSGTLANNLDVCGINCPPPVDGGGGTPPSPPAPDGDGDGVPDDSDTDGTGGSGAGGNTTNLSSGNRTITLEEGTQNVPTSGGLSTLSMGPGSTLQTTAAALLGPTKPAQLRMSTDTNTATGSNWSVPVYMDKYLEGTAAGGDYVEYRKLSSSANRDEELQVWSWNNSYAVQYRNAIGGGLAKQQAWAFGGNATAAMPTGGTASYAGAYVGTAETSNWIMPDGAEVNPNALWRVEGDSAVNANFGTGRVTGTITPQEWTSFQSGKNGWYTWDNAVGSPDPVTDPDYSFYHSTVRLSGTIAGSTYSGSAKINGAIVTGDNQMYGGFFGAGASETTGVFAADGVVPDPIGGNGGIEDDRRGILNINGAFNANCTATGVCP